MRLTSKQIDRLKDKYNVDRIWSFSRLNSFDQCIWDYWSHYLEHMNLDSSNVYTDFGTFSHEDIQEANAGLISREEMVKAWDSFVEKWSHDPKSHKFDTEKIKIGYLANLGHYYRNTDLLTDKKVTELKNEQPVMTLINSGKYVFVGYIDTKYKDENGNIVLIDYKTSSKSSFSKSHLPEKSKQLLLYSIGIHQQMGVPYDSIKARFDMMKYVTVHYKQENGKWNTSVQERSGWVSKMNKKLTTKLKKAGYSTEEIDEMVTIAGLYNNMDNIPELVKAQFYITNYYIELDISVENCRKLEKEIETECDQIMEFESLSRDEQISFMEMNHPYDDSNYYDTHLCAYHTSDYFKNMEGIQKQKNDPLEEIFGTGTTEDNVLEELFS